MCLVTEEPTKADKLSIGGVSTNTKRSSVQGSGKGSQKVEKKINQVAGLGGKWGGNTTKKEESIRVDVLPR